MSFTIEILEPGVATRSCALGGTVEVGRNADGIRLLDPTVSRHHLRLEPRADGIVVSDLGSRGGTIVNGYPITGPVLVRVGDWVVLGDSQLRIHAATDAPATASATGAPRDASPPTTVDQLEEIDVDGVAVVCFRKGSAGERAGRAMAAGVRRARRRLHGIGDDTRPVRIHLVDPFRADDGEVMTSGTLVDTTGNSVWMVVTAESPPEPPDRPLALLRAATLPAGDALAPLLEGYGLWLAKTPDPDVELAAMDLVPLSAAEGELRSAMGLSFVRFLIAREKEDGLRRLLTEAAPATLDATAQEIYGLSLTALERAWLTGLADEEPKVRTRQFLRLSLRYLRPHKFKQAEVFMYMLLALAFNTVFPFVTRNLFDVALPSGEFSQVARLLVLLGIALAISLAAGLRQAYLSAYISGAVVRDVRGNLFDKLQTLPTGWYARHQQGDVLTRLFSDVAIVEQGLTSTLRDGIFLMLSLVVSSIVMLTLSPILAVVVLAGAPLVGFVYRRMAKGARERGLAVQEDTGALMGVAAENYSAEPVVKLFGLQRREGDRFGRLSSRLFRSERRLSLFGGLFGLSVNTIMTFLRLAVLGLGAWMILNGSFTVGGLVAFLAIMGEVLSPVTGLTGIGQLIQAATGSLHRIDEVMNAESEVDDTSAPALAPLSHEIRFDSVDFAYTSERQVLTDVRATITAGTRVAFVGPSGSGKSTMLQLLMRLYDPDDGAITFDGTDLRTASLPSLREQLGVVFQDSFLFDTTLRENIALGKEHATEEEIIAAATAAEVHEFIMSTPRGYDTVVGERGGLLSGGQRQRVAIARALIRNPRVLLLDEATSALDPKTERQITATLAKISQGRTTIAITHRLTSVTDYDRIFVILDGRIVEHGRHDQLVAQGGVYARLWSEQTGQPVATAAPPPFDAAGALARIPALGALDAPSLAALAASLPTQILDGGQSIPDGDGSVAVVARGHGHVLQPALGGGWSEIAELGPGDAFGVSALLAGATTGAWLQATETTELLVVDRATWDRLGAEHAEVAQAIAGEETAAPRGRRLARMTVAMRRDDVEALLAGAREPEPAPVLAAPLSARATGIFTAPPNLPRD